MDLSLYFDSDVRRYLKFVEMSMEVLGMDQEAVEHFNNEHKAHHRFHRKQNPRRNRP